MNHVQTDRGNKHSRTVSVEALLERYVKDTVLSKLRLTTDWQIPQQEGVITQTQVANPFHMDTQAFQHALQKEQQK